MEEKTIQELLSAIELQFENWRYEEIDLANCNIVLVDKEGCRYD